MSFMRPWSLYEGKPGDYQKVHITVLQEKLAALKIRFEELLTHLIHDDLATNS